MTTIARIVPALALLVFPVAVALAQSESTGTEDVYVVVEQKPVFPGGEEAMFRFLKEQVVYPKEARNKGLQGTVYVTFTIDRTGQVRNVELLRGVHPLLDEEALRVVRSMPDWEPGRQRGKAVRTQYTLPIRFSLGGRGRRK
jgi:TonB family protein